jgi:putative lipoprotein (rSAM/lipoprotein system)
MGGTKKKIFRRWNAVIAWFLSLCGIACTNIACEYGTPEAKYNLVGTVTSEDTDAPIDHIRIIMGYDTAYSDAAGKYVVSTFEFPVSQTFNVNFSDVDGSINGQFIPRDTVVQYLDPEFHDGSGSWYRGETDQKLNIKLRSTK